MSVCFYFVQYIIFNFWIYFLLVVFIFYIKVQNKTLHTYKFLETMFYF